MSTEKRIGLPRVCEEVMRSIGPRVVEALLAVRHDMASGRIEAEAFDMSGVVSRCGTAACIAGHALARMRRCDLRRLSEEWFRGKTGVPEDYADLRELGGLKALFEPWLFTRGVTHSMDYNDVARAVRAIDHYLETGDGRWPV